MTRRTATLLASESGEFPLPVYRIETTAQLLLNTLYAMKTIRDRERSDTVLPVVSEPDEAWIPRSLTPTQLEYIEEFSYHLMQSDCAERDRKFLRRDSHLDQALAAMSHIFAEAEETENIINGIRERLRQMPAHKTPAEE